MLNVMELFAGAGGMGLGFLLAQRPGRRYRIILSAEIHPVYVETLRHNHRTFARMAGGARADDVPGATGPLDMRIPASLDLAERTAGMAGGVDVLIGGPPCQGFSSANRNSWNSANPNNRLVSVFFDYVERIRPAIFVMENVQGILWEPLATDTQQPLDVLDTIAQRMDVAGYLLFPKLLDAVWYGVPQRRHRFFLIGLRRDLEYSSDDFGEWGPYPAPTHGPYAERPIPYVNAWDAIGDLPEIGNGHNPDRMDYREPTDAALADNAYLKLMRDQAESDTIFDHVTSRHAAYVIDRYRRIPQGGNWENIRDDLTNYADADRTHSNIYRRLVEGEPCVTMGHYRKSMLIHPRQDRGLSLREGARLQSFPDWFRFAGSDGALTASAGRGGLTHKQQQVANAVCPLVTKVMAERILEL